VGHVRRAGRGGGRALTSRVPPPRQRPRRGDVPRWGDADGDWLEELFADESGIWDLFVVVFYLPVILGCLLYLFQFAGGAFGVQQRLLGDEDLLVSHVLFGAAIGLGLVGLSRLGELSGPGARAGEELARHMGHVTWYGLVPVAAAAALGEELLFRGVLQNITNVYAAAILFAAAHVPFREALWPWTVQALVHGFLFGALTLPDDSSLVMPIVAHAVFNASQLIRWKLRLRQG
jgi:membrane protease YdiL (CAAX protease family)